MAKKTAKKATPKKAVKKAVKKKPAAKKEPAAKKAAPAKSELTDHAIGTTAGEVWKLLTENDSMTIAAVKKGVDVPGDQALMAIGWLAREGKLRFETQGRSAKVSLA